MYLKKNSYHYFLEKLKLFKVKSFIRNLWVKFLFSCLIAYIKKTEVDTKPYVKKKMIDSFNDMSIRLELFYA